MKMRKTKKLLTLLAFSFSLLTSCEKPIETLSETSDSSALDSGSMVTKDGFLVGTSKDGGVRIDGYRGKEDYLDIPSTIDGRPVTSIGAAAFYEHITLVTVVIPKGVTSIGEYAFQGCISLSHVVIPDTVTSIAHDAFNLCKSLSYVELPPGLTAINDKTFGQCKSLFQVVVPDGVSHIGKAAFSGCSSMFIFNIPSALETIGDSAFEGCSAIRSLKLPDTLTSIGEFAFDGCSSLTSLSIPKNVTYIGSYAFRYCQMGYVDIPDKVTLIANSAFAENPLLTYVVFPRGLEKIDKAFYGCTSLASVYYRGTSEAWQRIKKNDEIIQNATTYFYSETEPSEPGNYWRYVEGVPTHW